MESKSSFRICGIEPHSRFCFTYYHLMVEQSNYFRICFVIWLGPRSYLDLYESFFWVAVKLSTQSISSRDAVQPYMHSEFEGCIFRELAGSPKSHEGLWTIMSSSIEKSSNSCRGPARCTSGGLSPQSEGEKKEPKGTGLWCVEFPQPGARTEPGGRKMH